MDNHLGYVRSVRRASGCLIGGPPFRLKAGDVCVLYLDLKENWAVFSVDEKTGIQVTSRINPTQPAVEDQPARREFDYRLHGTEALFSAFECGPASGPTLVQRAASWTPTVEKCG